MSRNPTRLSARLKRLEKAATFCPACGGRDGVHLARDPRVLDLNLRRAGALGLLGDLEKLSLIELDIIANDGPGGDVEAQ